MHISKVFYRNQTNASTSYSSLSLSVTIVLCLCPPFFLHLSHLFICCCLTVFIIALALAQHVLPKHDTEMEFEKKSVWEIEETEEDADREKQGAIKSNKSKEQTRSDVRERERCCGII